jgi:ribosomal protein L6P/L9E
MILGISIPDGARVEVVGNKVQIIFDEKETTRDLWKARFDMWLTEGESVSDFQNNKTLDNKGMILTVRNKLKF